MKSEKTAAGWVELLDLRIMKHEGTGLLMMTSEKHRGVNLAGHSLDDLLSEARICLPALGIEGA